MEFVIGGIVILICLYIVGYLLKKKYYKEVDRLETWKMDLTNHPVPDEMSKVKKLNMTGQTEELFEKWRSEWDEIVTSQLPKVEEYLFDTEEFIDKYRFKKAKEMQEVINNHLTNVEENIKRLLSELHDLVGSEEKNRVEIEELKETYRSNKKTILAHSHTYGKAVNILEMELNDITPKFAEYDEKTKSGNYLEAREIVFTIQSQMELINNKMEHLPSLLVECKSKLPTQINELKDGYAEMVEQGFILDHIQMDSEINRIEKEIATNLAKLENADIENVQESMDDIKESIDRLYDSLEIEVKAKHFIIQQDQATRTILYTQKEMNDRLKEELQIVRQSYHLSESDLENYTHLDKNWRSLIKKYEVLEHKINSQGTAHSLLKEELESIKDELDEISESQKVLVEKLQTLRKDEVAARDKVKELSKNVSETIRLVAKSNVPGLPQDYQYLIQDAEESIDNVLEKLEEKPLNIPTVQQYLEIAVLTVEKALNTTNEMIETIAIVEKVIQYGNRYRSRYPSVNKGLAEAEELFRSYDYKTALEQAASTIEEIEPGAMKKIEALLDEN